MADKRKADWLYQSYFLTDLSKNYKRGMIPYRKNEHAFIYS